ncbi:MAG: radical SAM protein [Bacteroidota bacterium]|nr:radical SAM protein [Bacteroidota bacterium]
MIEEKLNLRWGCNFTIDIADDEEVLSQLTRAGCRVMFIGLESLDSKNMLQLNKPYDPARYLNQIRKIRKHGIMVGTYFIMGLDNDDTFSFDDVYKFYQESRVEVPYTHMFVPIPGTPLYNTIRSAGRLHTEAYDNYSTDNAAAFSVPCSVAYFQPAKMTEEELEQNYLNLNARVLTLPKILRRSLKKHFIDTSLVLGMNLEARKKYKAMQAAKLQKLNDKALHTKFHPSSLLT